MKHSNFEVDTLERLYAERKTVAPDSEVRAAIREAKQKGYAYIPACENIKPDGSCAGHEGDRP